MPRKVLIIDDNDMNRSVLRNILHTEYDVLEAENGKDALTLLQRRHKSVSAVVLDLVMPVMDGFEVLKRMQNSALLSQIPVIVATGMADEDAEVRALSLGANDFVTKPYNPALILHSLRNTINLRETASTVNALQQDKLTRLYNREAFFEKASAMLKQHPPGYYIMACFDVDNFKVINDQHGAEEGDRILRFIGNAVQRDMLEIGGIGSRIAADNFAALYPVENGRMDFVARIQSDETIPQALRTATAFSIGRYVVTDLSLSTSAIYDRAYIAKQSVKGRYDTHIAYFDESMRDRLLREQEIISDMDAALSLKQFEIWFQPQFNHATGALIGAEALVRWRHPKNGLMFPGDFIPVFEQNGFIYELDKYVWDHVCALLRSWLDAGRKPLPVSVNVSRYDIFKPDLFEVITGLVKQYELPVDLLRLEITESAFARSAEQIINQVKRFIDYGFTVEIDDFGSGYSSLNTLKDVPAQVLKLDMRFLENAGDSQRGGNILESVVRMAKWLGMSVIAEGVEARKQADFLKSIGCNYIQGYLYAKPIPAADYETLAKNAGKEQRLLTMETVENLDNNAFWDPESMDTLIFNSYIGGACIFEYRNGRIELLRANDKYTQVLGITVESALKLNWIEHLDKDSRRTFLAALEHSIATNDEVSGEFVFLDLPGCPHKTYLRSTLRVIATAGDDCCLIYCTNENITAQRQAEQKEHEAEQKQLAAAEQLQAIMDDADIGIVAAIPADGRMRFLFANDKYYQILGYTRSQYEAEVMDLADLIHPEDKDTLFKLLENAYHTGIPTRVEYRVNCRNGALRWVRVAVSATRFTGVEQPVQLCLFSDITAEKQSEQTLRESDEQLKFLNDTAHELLAQPDCGKGIEHVLQTLLDYFGGNRAYVFEFDHNRTVSNNTYEVCTEGVIAEKNNLQNIPMSLMTFWLHAFDQKSYISIKDVDALDNSRAEERAILSEQGIKSLIAVPLKRDGKLIGFLGIDDPRCKQEQVGRLRAIGDYIAVMMTRRDLDAKIESGTQTLFSLMNDTPGGFVRMRVLPDGSAVPLYFNRGFCQLVAMDHEALTALYARDAMAGVHPDDIGIVREAVAHMLEKGEAHSAKYRLQYGKGGYIWVMFFGRTIHSETGETFLNIYYTDAGGEAAAGESSDAHAYRQMLPVALSAVMRSSIDFSFVKDRDGRYLCCSRPFLKGMQLADESEIIGKTDYDLLDKKYADHYTATDREVIRTRQAQLDLNGALPTSGGAMRYGSTSKYPLFDPDGNVIGIYGVTRDTTEYRVAFERLKLVTDNLPGGIAAFALSPSGIRITYFNEGFYQFSGYSREEFAENIARDALFMVFPEDRPRARAAIEAIRSGDSDSSDCAFRCNTKDGNYRWFVLKGVISERNGNSCIVNAVQFDITEQKETEERLRVSEEQFRIAAVLSDRIVARYNLKTGVYYNDSPMLLEQGFGHKIENVPQAFIDAKVVAPDSVSLFFSFYQSLRDGAPNATATVQLRTPDGSFPWFCMNAATIFDPDGRPSEAIIVFFNVTEEREKEAVYKKWQQSLRDKSPDSYTLFRCNLSKDASVDSAEGTLLQIDFSAGAATFDMRTAEYANQYVFPEDRRAYITALNSDSLLAGYYRGKRSFTLDYREILSAESVRWLRLSVELVEYPHSSDVEVYLMYEDINNSKQEELLTRERAETDPLTGVLNRTAFVEKMNQSIAESRPGNLNALLMFDIDSFKQINDTFGHAAGDKALVDMSENLRSVLRANDLVGRLGGDEFLVCLHDIPTRDAIAKKARHICSLLRQPLNSEMHISASIGIAVSPDDGKDFEALYRKADIALYNVKGAGKDDFAFYIEKLPGEQGYPPR